MGPAGTNNYCCCLATKSWLTPVTPWTVARQAPLSMGFPRQEYWSALPFPFPGDLPGPGIEPALLHSQADSLPPSHQGSLRLTTAINKVKPGDQEPSRSRWGMKEICPNPWILGNCRRWLCSVLTFTSEYKVYHWVRVTQPWLRSRKTRSKLMKTK